MAWELGHFNIPGLICASSADLSTSQYRFVKLVDVNEVDVAASSDIPIGVLQNKPDSEEEAEVMAMGITKLVSGSTVAVPSHIGVDANGKVEEFSTGAGEYMVGLSLTSASAAGDIITCMINCTNPVLNELSSV